jgi:hypothetical protein
MANRALLVGINAYRSAPLRGCLNDVQDMAAFLTQNRGFKPEEIQMLCDGRAATQNILERLHWLVSGLSAGDKICFHYSGHGAQAPSYGQGNEPDGLYEIICPADFDWSPNHMITDKQLVQIFQTIPPGVKFNWGSDSCHSGDLSRDILPAGQTSRAFPVPIDIAWDVGIARGKFKAREMVGGLLNVGYISGCKSNQTSADAFINGRACGAMTHYFLQTMTQNPPHMSLSGIVATMIPNMQKAGYSQVPQAEGAGRDLPYLA